MEHVDSYYKKTQRYQLQTEALAQQETCEVCVIGGGFSGINTALELAEKGVDVILLEANKIGWGGSGRNGGQAICGIGHDPQLIRKQLSEQDFDSLYGMGLEALKTLKGRITKYEIDCDYREGYCTVAYDEKRLQQLREAAQFFKDCAYPFQLDLLEGEALTQVVSSEKYVGGLLDKGSGHLHPLNLVLGEANAAQSLGVRIFEQSAVTQIEKGNKLRIHTAGGSVVADKLVMACNAYLEGLEPYLQSRFVTTNAFSVSTEPLSQALVDELMPAGAAVCDNRPVIDYYRMTPDRRLLFGGATHFVEYLPKDLKKHIRKNMFKVFPQLADVALEDSWSGKMAIGANLFPQVNQLADQRIYYVQAYAGFGVGPSHLVAKAIAQEIVGEQGAFQVLSKIKHPYIFAAKALNPLWVTAGKCLHQIEAKF